ncbi:hypothetical protein K501DRAFT_326680 [Backusella circina FSU 941]|nr:hypothetical protein K501DRAFT_326680 [Backusella circina FSU 941]
MPNYNNNNSNDNNNNNNNNIDTELDMIEHAMNTMMKGTFSLLFKQLVEPSIFESNPSMTTTIINGNNVNNNNNELAAVDDEFGGNDFKRLAQKSKKNRGVISNDDVSQENNKDREIVRFSDHANSSDSMINPIGSIFNLLLGGGDELSHIINQTSMRTNTDQNSHADDGWLYSSTSQRTVVQPDGTQETITTTKRNGVTETVKQIKYADGRMEESREEKKSIWQRLWRG